MSTEGSQSTLSATSMKSPKSLKARIDYFDNIRWLMIVLVVLMHINVTYSCMGRWYYNEPKDLDMISRLFFVLYAPFVQAFFMGILFLLAGNFVPGSVDRKGSWRYLQDRSFRLGIPTLIYMLILHPLTLLALDSFSQISLGDLGPYYAWYLRSFEFVGESGPLWFALALLLFTVIYTVLRGLFKKISLRACIGDKNIITHANIFHLAVLVSIMTFLVRLMFPIGTAVLNMQICFFAQYVILFCVGLVAYRYDLFTRIPFRMGMTWFRIALFGGIPLLILLILFEMGPHGFDAFMGGLTWQAAVYAVWESFVCIGMCVGLVTLFRDKYNHTGTLSRFLADNAFGVFVFHPPLLVLYTLSVKNWQAYPLVKWLAAAVIVIPASFLFVCLIRKIPGMKLLFS
jgi:glucan biosynthesis protein C